MPLASLLSGARLAFGAARGALSGYLTYILLAVIAALVLAAGVQTVRLAGARAELASTISTYERRIVRAHEESRLWSRALVAAIERALETYHAQLATIAAQAALLAASDAEAAAIRARTRRLEHDNARLRGDLEQYARPSSGDSLAACQSRAGRLADLLGAGAGLVQEADELVAEAGDLVGAYADVARGAATAEATHAAAVNLCYRAWPRLQ
jgi:uncharacterized protein YigA (DUF484 family)